MRFWQKGTLFALSILTLTVVGLGAALAVRPLAVYPQEELPGRPATSTAAAAATAVVNAIAQIPGGSSETPFQPLPITPTPSPTPTATNTPVPTSTPTATETPSPSATPTVPEGVFLSGIYGFQQAFNLSCEARSAVDLARYFNFSINEINFLYALPSSDNPETGFVGDPNDALGQLPPDSYGVHADPVARLLRDYGLNARARKGLGLVDLIAELNAGRPVMVWAIKDLAAGQAVEYTALDGDTTIVARFEHTFLVIGYNSETITVLDNDRIYSVPISQFLTSWEVLGNMAVIIE